MRFRTLSIHLGAARVGLLFQYGEGKTAITRLIPDESFWRQPDQARLSWATYTTSETARDAFWRGYTSQPFFNGEGTALPAFFQNMLPEGALRRHLAEIRACDVNDHFEIFAACGTDLPGNVYAYPARLTQDEVAGFVTQHNDALEMSVVADPMAEASSLSGIQPKLHLVHAQGGRYVARTKDERGIHIIAKLPSIEFPLLPEVEELSLRLAAAAGVQTCNARLAPIRDIAVDVPFVIDQTPQFLAVERFDRQDGRQHIHCEDFAQILGVQPEMKYTHELATYATLAQVMTQTMSMQRGAVEELLRRIAVNELLGNYDAHLKNFGVIYRDGRTPELSPAYDVVAYAAYLPGRGHGMRFAPGGQRQARLTPATVREFCEQARFPETVAQSTIRDVVKRAVRQWPEMISQSMMRDEQKARLMRHFEQVPMVSSYMRRVACN